MSIRVRVRVRTIRVRVRTIRVRVGVRCFVVRLGLDMYDFRERRSLRIEPGNVGF